MPAPELRLVCGLFGLIFLAASEAQAESAADVFRKYDLYGTWALDCTKPMSRENQHIIRRPLDAGQVEEVTRFETQAIVSNIDVAVELKPNEIQISQTNERGRINQTVRIERNRMRTFLSMREGGEVLISGGRFTSDNMVTPWLIKCNGLQSAPDTPGYR